MRCRRRKALRSDEQQRPRQPAACAQQAAGRCARRGRCRSRAALRPPGCGSRAPRESPRRRPAAARRPQAGPDTPTGGMRNPGDVEVEQVGGEVRRRPGPAARRPEWRCAQASRPSTNARLKYMPAICAAAGAERLHDADLAHLPGEHRRDQVHDQEAAQQQRQDAERALREQQRIHLRGVDVPPRHRNVDVRHRAAGAFRPRRARRRDRGARRRGRAAVRARRSAVRRLTCAPSCASVAARDEAVDDVLHPARRQPHVARDARHRAADAASPSANCTRQRFADRRCRRNPPTTPRRRTRRRAAARRRTRGLTIADPDGAEVVGREQDRRAPAFLHAARCRRRCAAPRASPIAGSARTRVQQRRVDGIDRERRGRRDCWRGNSPRVARRSSDQVLSTAPGAQDPDRDGEHDQQRARLVLPDVAQHFPPARRETGAPRRGSGYACAPRCARRPASPCATRSAARRARASP